jgi:hypothetical protein
MQCLVDVVRGGSSARIEVIGISSVGHTEFLAFWSGSTATIQDGKLAMIELRMRSSYVEIMRTPVPARRPTHAPGAAGRVNPIGKSNKEARHASYEQSLD